MQHNVYLWDTMTQKQGIYVMIHLIASFVCLDMLFFQGQFSYKHNSKHASKSISFLYKFDDDVVATDSSEMPMNDDLDDLQLSCTSIINSTNASSSSEVKLFHLVYPPHLSSLTDCHDHERLG